VVLVGYDLQRRFWLAKNSWGAGFAEGGFFRVAFDANVGICNPKDTYGFVFSAADAPALPKLLPLGKNCYSYRTAPSDYVSKIARVFGVPSQRVLADNSRAIREPDMFLGLLNLKLCGVQKKRMDVRFAQPPVVDSQVSALLGIKAFLDKAKVLSFAWPAHKFAGYCQWPGVRCNQSINQNAIPAMSKT
jgi:hypothetical protein